MNSSERADFEAALAEYVQSQMVDADRAEAHLNLAGVYVEQGELDRAEAEYKTALALDAGHGRRLRQLRGPLPAEGPRRRGREACCARA